MSSSESFQKNKRSIDDGNKIIILCYVLDISIQCYKCSKLLKKSLSIIFNALDGSSIKFYM